MKYTVYFDKKGMKEDADLITICESVDSVRQALSAAQEDMVDKGLVEECLYMYIIYEEDYNNIQETGLPDSHEVRWEDILFPKLQELRDE